MGVTLARSTVPLPPSLQVLTVSRPLLISRASSGRCDQTIPAQEFDLVVVLRTTHKLLVQSALLLLLVQLQNGCWDEGPGQSHSHIGR